MQNRLAEIKNPSGSAVSAPGDHSTREVSPSDSLEIAADKDGNGNGPQAVEGNGAPEGEGASDSFLVDFFGQVSEISNQIAFYRNLLTQLTPLYSERARTIGREKVASIQSDIAVLQSRAQQVAQNVKVDLKNMADDNRRFCEQHPSRTGEARIRVNQHQRLIRQFMRATEEYEHLQAQQKAEMQGTVYSTLRNIRPGLDDQQIRDLVEQPENLRPMLLQEELDLEEGSLGDEIADLEMRNQEIAALEESIRELHQMFLDLSVLVESQGELIDQIESNVQGTRKSVKQGVKNLQRARGLQRCSHKLMWCIIILLIILIVVIVVPVVVKTVKG
jgi:t-SNARE complex subunit (syntaxin)